MHDNNSVGLGFSAQLGCGSLLRKPLQIFTSRFWRDLRFAVRMAWQRAVRGYDDSMIWEMDDYLLRFLVVGLNRLAGHHSGVPDLNGTLSALELQPDDVAERLLHDANRVWTARLREIAGELYEALTMDDNPCDYSPERQAIIEAGFSKLALIFRHLWD